MNLAFRLHKHMRNMVEMLIRFTPISKLKKILYCLKQAPRQWYKNFESTMGEQGYRKTTSDHCVFVHKFSNDDFVILLLYVDDILIAGRNV